jgi:hypothetical protein
MPNFLRFGASFDLSSTHFITGISASRRLGATHGPHWFQRTSNRSRHGAAGFRSEKLKTISSDLGPQFVASRNLNDGDAEESASSSRPMLNFESAKSQNAEKSETKV